MRNCSQSNGNNQENPTRWIQTKANNRSHDQTIKRSDDQTIKRSHDQTIKRSHDPSIKRSNDQMIEQSSDHMINNQTIRWSINQVIKRSNVQTIKCCQMLSKTGPYHAKNDNLLAQFQNPGRTLFSDQVSYHDNYDNFPVACWNLIVWYDDIYKSIKLFQETKSSIQGNSCR